MVYRFIVILVFGGMVGNYMQAADRGQTKESDQITFAVDSHCETKESEEVAAIKGVLLEELSLENCAIQSLLQFIYSTKNSPLSYLRKKMVKAEELEPWVRTNTNIKWSQALLYASGSGNVDAVRILSDAKVRWDMCNEDGVTALMYAAHASDNEPVETMRVLNELYPGSINERDNDGSTALMHAASFGKWDRLRWLCKGGARIEDRDVEKLLQYAVCKNGDKEIINELLAMSSNQAKEYLNKPDKINGNKTILMEVAAAGNVEIMEILIGAGAEINARDKKGHTVLMHAAKRGQWKAVESLCEKGAKIAKFDVEQLLQYAVKGKGSIDFINQLFNIENIDLNKRIGQSSKTTLLEEAVSAYHKEAVKLLLKKGAKINVFGGHGNILTYATDHTANEDILCTLLEFGAKDFINTPDSFGYTPLMLTIKIWTNCVKLVPILLKFGADVNIKNGQETALTYAMKYHIPTRWNHGEDSDSDSAILIRLLREAGAKTSEELDSTIVASNDFENKKLAATAESLGLPQEEQRNAAAPAPAAVKLSDAAVEAHLPQVANDVPLPLNQSPSFWSSQNYGTVGLAAVLAVALCAFGYYKILPQMLERKRA